MSRIFCIRILTILILGFSGLVQAADRGPTTAQSNLPVEIPATSPQVIKAGRFATTPTGVRAQWSASQVSLAFSGTDVQIRINDEGNNYFEVELDGQVVGSFHPARKTANVIDLARNLTPGRHVVRVMKRTEAHVGPVTFEAFLLNDGGKALDLPAAPHRIEVIGDSISCGYGNEGTNPKEHFTPATENAYLTYGALTARAFAADYVCIAWSGKKMWPNNTIPELYDRVFPFDANSKWDFASWKPEVVLINLATNDFGRENPERAGWIKGYTEFVKRVRGNYPDATIYLALGSMMNDAYPKKENKALTTAREYVQQVLKDLQASGETKVKFIEFSLQNPTRDGVGNDWHPGLKTHQIMAQRFIEAIRNDLQWQPVAPSK